MDQLLASMADTLQQVVTLQANPGGKPKPKAIQCKSFKLGESWPSYVTHFVECVKAAHGFKLPDERTDLDNACILWLPTKLEQGPTLSAYNSLEPTVKQTFDARLSLIERMLPSFQPVQFSSAQSSSNNTQFQ